MTTTVNQIGQVIEIKKAVCREFDTREIFKYIRRANNGSYPLSFSWGFKSPYIMVKDKAIRFTVSGHHHKGHVYIVLDGSDTFTIYYCSNRGTIKKISEMIYIDMLVDVLDRDIERIKEYFH